MIKKFAPRWTVARPFVAALLVTLIAAFCIPAANAQSTAKTKKTQASKTAQKDKVEAGYSIVVGETFPTLELKDQSGEVFDMAASLEKGPVALVIFRSADW